MDGLKLYTASLRDAGANAPTPLCEIKARSAKPAGNPARGNREIGLSVVHMDLLMVRLSAGIWDANPPLIDIVKERKRNADGVCPCGFQVIGDEETNVDSVF